MTGDPKFKPSQDVPDFAFGRIENMLFEGTPQPRQRADAPTSRRAGNGLELKHLSAAMRSATRIHL
jgi:hypothetical protein